MPWRKPLPTASSAPAANPASPRAPARPPRPGRGITAVVGTPMDVTVEELAIESFYPADDQTAALTGRPRP